MAFLAGFGVFVISCWVLSLYGWSALFMLAGVVLLTVIWEREGVKRQ